jgi:hypothetical protein
MAVSTMLCVSLLVLYPSKPIRRLTSFQLELRQYELPRLGSTKHKLSLQDRDSRTYSVLLVISTIGTSEEFTL